MLGDVESGAAAFSVAFTFTRSQSKTIELLNHLADTDPNPSVKAAAAKALESPLIRNVGATSKSGSAAEDESPPGGHEAKPVPSYRDYMAVCMQSAEGSRGFGSNVDRATAQARCECIYQHFPRAQVMTKSEFVSSGIACQRESEQDLDAFMQRYLPADASVAIHGKSQVR